MVARVAKRPMVSSSDAGIKLRWAGLTLFTPVRTFFVIVKGAQLEILTRHVYHVMLWIWSAGCGASVGVIGVSIRCLHHVLLRRWCWHMFAPPLCRHSLLWRWCWQRLAYPNSWYVLVIRWCWQRLAPPHSFYVLLMRWGDEMGWFDTFKTFSHLFGDRKRGVSHLERRWTNLDIEGFDVQVLKP